MSTYEKFKQLLSEYDVAYANYFKSPEVLATLTKTFTSHNITVEEWNTLIDSIKNNLELSPYLKQIVDSLDDCFEDFLEQVQYLPDTVQRIQYVHSGTEKQTFIQQVGNPENLSVDDAPAENIASQWWASAFGKSNKATNYASFVCGTRNENNGDSAFVTGVGNINGSILLYESDDTSKFGNYIVVTCKEPLYTLKSIKIVLDNKTYHAADEDHEQEYYTEKGSILQYKAYSVGATITNNTNISYGTTTTLVGANESISIPWTNTTPYTIMIAKHILMEQALWKLKQQCLLTEANQKCQ